MSALSTLAQNFEANSKQQASDTAKAVQSALQQHEKALIEQLRSSEKTLSVAIQLREANLSTLLDTTEASTRATVLKSWKWLGLSIALALSASFGALWWTGQQIATNLEALSEQKKALALAPRGVEFSSDKSGHYIVLPPKTTLKAGWTHANGTRQAFKLEAAK